MITVKKPFNTALQRWQENDVITAGADLFPHTIESLKAGGFVAVPATKKATPSDLPGEPQ